MNRHTAAVVLKTAATVLLLVFLAYRVDLEGLAGALRDASIGAVAIGVLLGFPVMVVSGLRWRLISGQLRIPLPARFAVLGYMESICFNLILPGSLAGDAIRIAKVTRARGHLRRNLAAVLFDRAANLVVLLLLCIPASVLMLGKPGMENLLLVLGALAAISLGAACALALSNRLWKLRRYRPMREMVYFSVMAKRFLVRDSVLPGVGIQTLVVQFLAIAMLACAVASVGVAGLSAVELAVATLLGLLAGALPLTIAGIGLREGALIWTLEAFGVDSTSALAAAIVFAAILLLQAVPGLTIWLAGMAQLPRRPQEKSLPG